MRKKVKELHKQIFYVFLGQIKRHFIENKKSTLNSYKMKRFRK